MSGEERSSKTWKRALNCHCGGWNAYQNQIDNKYWVNELL